MTSTQASEKSMRFLSRLAAERNAVAEVAHYLGGSPSQADVSREIDRLLNAPKPEPAQLQPGVYETDGQIYVVKPNQAKTRVYAKRLVEINAQRLNENDQRIRIEFEYASGAIFRIRPEHLMPYERARELTIRYGRCICCSRFLKAAESVERGIGPICRKYFRQ